MQITFQRFMHMQQREIEHYQQDHSELSRSEAAFQWIKKYAIVFRKWFDLNREN